MIFKLRIPVGDWETQVSLRTKTGRTGHGISKNRYDAAFLYSK